MQLAIMLESILIYATSYKSTTIDTSTILFTKFVSY